MKMTTRTGLYRTGEYREQPPNANRTIIAPAGEPIYLMPEDHHLQPAETLPPCPDCGGIIEWAEYGRVPGSRKCAGCNTDYILQTVNEPDGTPWPWQDGRLTLIDTG